MIESFGGGIAVLDFDLDGWQDLFFTCGGHFPGSQNPTILGYPSALYRNFGEWQFRNVSEPSRVNSPTDYSQGCAVTDYDGDGFADLFVCCYGRSRLFRNLGDGTFSELSEREMPAFGWGTAAAFGDWDGDSFPDLVLTRYTDWSPEKDVECYGRAHERDLCGPTSYPPATSSYFKNSGNGSFQDLTDTLQLTADAHGMGVIATDLNLDGRIDFYISSDALQNRLFLGRPDNRFVDTAMECGVAVGEWGQPEASMGIDVNDYNGDGLPDIFVTNFEKEDHSLYRNIRNSQWVHSTVAAGLSASSRLRVGFGTSFCDFNGDHWPDLFVLNGNPIYTTAESPFGQRPQLFQNSQGKRFTEISQLGGPYFKESHSGRGSVIGDFDNDGDFDLVVSLMNEPIRVLRNRRESNRFVNVRLIARNGDRDAIGASIRYSSGGREWTQFSVHGGSYFSQSDSRFVIPLQADESEVTIEVRWPGRHKESFRRLSPGATHTLIEGKGVVADEPG